VQVLVLFISSLNQLLFRPKLSVCYFSKCSYNCYYFSRLLRWTTWALTDPFSSNRPPEKINLDRVSKGRNGVPGKIIGIIVGSIQTTNINYFLGRMRKFLVSEQVVRVVTTSLENVTPQTIFEQCQRCKINIS
jgi:hypothetical protein